MSESSGQQLPTEPHEGIDAASTREARTYEAKQTPALARATGGEAAPATDAPEAGEAPVVEGTGAGDPLAGVRASDADVEEAVAGDEGPEHPGVRRST
jgi:hypothetical protein